MDALETGRKKVGGTVAVASQSTSLFTHVHSWDGDLNLAGCIFVKAAAARWGNAINYIARALNVFVLTTNTDPNYKPKGTAIGKRSYKTENTLCSGHHCNTALSRTDNIYSTHSRCATVYLCVLYSTNSEESEKKTRYLKCSLGDSLFIK